MDVIQVQLRNQFNELARFSTPCDDEVLLEQLPWLDLHNPVSILPAQLTTTIVTALDSGAHLVLGPRNQQPTINTDSTLHTVRSLAHTNPSTTTWIRLCKLFEQIDEDMLFQHMDELQDVLNAWPADIRKPPERWRWWKRGHDKPYPLGIFLSSVENLEIDRHTIPSQFFRSPSKLFQGLIHLKSVDFKDFEITDLSMLTACTQLRQIQCRNLSRATTIQPLTVLTELWNVSLEQCHNIVDLTPLSHLNKCKHLKLRGISRSADIGFLTNYFELTSLHIQDADVDDWSPLCRPYKLKALELDNTSLHDLSILRNLHALSHLTLNNTHIADPWPLISIRSLKKISIQNTTLAHGELFQQLHDKGVEVQINNRPLDTSK